MMLITQTNFKFINENFEFVIRKLMQESLLLFQHVCEAIILYNICSSFKPIIALFPSSRLKSAGVITSL